MLEVCLIDLCSCGVGIIQFLGCLWASFVGWVFVFYGIGVLICLGCWGWEGLFAAAFRGLGFTSGWGWCYFLMCLWVCFWVAGFKLYLTGFGSYGWFWLSIRGCGHLGVWDC